MGILQKPPTRLNPKKLGLKIPTPLKKKQFFFLFKKKKKKFSGKKKKIFRGEKKPLFFRKNTIF
ncbi:hypothetical protein EBI_25671 [Enterocytozoon bieneusi H348]|nr:hypothetical protein EBI_25671 [Enterocytozoon bieneusi H348]|eukprot:XP_002651063.1 hypothetical protein EBI_25671 [Enterocytozoon bieneusi H348]